MGQIGTQLAAGAVLCLLFSLQSTAELWHSRDHGTDPQEQRTRDPGDQTVWVETLAWKPRAFLYHNFLTQEECEHLIKLGKPHMAKSMVVDNDTGKEKPSDVRTSFGMFLVRSQDDTVRAIEERIARFSKVPYKNGESLQILQYEPSQKYEPHFDYFHDDVNIQNGGQRIATMLLYLTDVEEGGETVFPSSPEKPHVGNANYSTCAQQGVAVKPKAGDALLFFSLTPDSQLDELSLHSGCPVIRGTKWSATKWMRVSEFDLPDGEGKAY